ncbi:hypothetical protein AGRA3207_001141 [Actinomadura graeca]|uniref:Uncharacterized protein n=1 Tax=Actinomadura graeca TaxID=2750812 RepID=A0ABX8QNU2_9ACTN|nr:hypothetical protein [Actinomadura graeca]QXJ20428.1 hypothetical protein AGRA3207_001141 [Actinomadura graeca]
MAWQLHYTSARRGPTGRAGFQFVAETPGLPDGVRAGVTPYLSYRPPPDAPLSPDDAELDLFPVSLLYDRVDGRPLLLRCRYLGRDYSGRYGNFFAHAVVAEPAELEGLRPAELWHAPLWTGEPATGPDLEELDELTPGAVLDPEALATWLAAGPGPAPRAAGERPEDPYATLARLVDAVAAVLRRGHGRVVLIAGDVELIARWIAVVSYSLPVAAAAGLSFVTYTADPDGAAQRLVGTTPDVWAAVRHHTSHAAAIDLRGGGTAAGPSRFARTVADCWRDADFAGLDALAELAHLDAGTPDGAAALLALCRGDASVTPGEEETAARLLARLGDAGPGGPLLDGLVSGLAGSGRRDLTAATCDLLSEHPGRLRAAPSVAVAVLASVGRRRRDRRVAVTGELLRLGDGDGPAGGPARDTAPGRDLDAALEQVWTSPPSASECVALLDAHPEAMAGRPVLAVLPSRTFARLADARPGKTGAGAVPPDAGLTDAAALRLAARVRAVAPDGPAGCDATVVQAHADAVTADGPRQAARALEDLAGASGANPRLVDAAFTGAARRLCRRPPPFRAALLAAASTAVRARLGGRWTAELPGRARAGRAPLRGAEVEQRNQLVEVVLRLRKRGVTEPALETWARAAAARWLAARQLDSHFAGEPQLQAALKDLLAEARGR